MELKRGFKQTALGVLPESWEAKPCSSVTEKIMVGIVIRPSQYYMSQGVPAFRSANIREGGINSSDLVFISERANALLGKSQVQTGDILTVRTGYPGTSAVVTSSFAGSNCIDVLISRPARSVVPEYLAAWINSPFGKSQVLRNQGGLAQQHFNVRDLRNLLVAVPPLPEQAAIARARCDVDALLKALDQVIAKKRDLKQAAMQQLLTGQLRLPGFKGKWELKRVDEMGSVVAGKALDAYGSGCRRPYLRTKNVLDGRIDLEDVLEMPMTDAEFERFRVVNGDVLLNEGQSLELVGRCSMYRGELSVPCAMQNQLLRFRAREQVSPAFAEHLFRYCQRNGIFARIATQTTSVAHLGSARFSSLRLSWPSDPAEQCAVATVCSDMDAELTALEKRRDKTRLLKQGMMQELLTGRTRLV